jgi:Uma2 family endonuclease
MVTVASDPSHDVAPPGSEPFGLTAEAFLRGVEHDLFPTDRRVFLWEGRLYEKMAKKLAHAAATETAREAIGKALPEGWGFWGENPILADEFTAPLPDLAVVRGNARDYFARRTVPRAEEVGLVIEAADRTLGDDLTTTLRKYAAAGLPVYWVLNLVDWRVEVFSGPRVEGGVPSYSSRTTHVPGGDVPLVLDGVEVARIPVDAILPGEKPR